jgi:pseudaminic acid cytidylyltransferase
MIGIVPARGGSKRVPRKNIRLVDGRPLMSYPIQALRESSLVREVFVSSDSEEILDIAKSFSAKAVKRDPQLSDDNSGLLEVVQDFIKRELSEAAPHQLLICVLPTALDLSPEILSQAKALSESDAGSMVLAAKEFSHPIERAMSLNETGALVPLDNVAMRKRTQDLSPKYFDSGMFYLATIDTWSRRSSILGEGALPLFLPPEIGIDIDTESDLDFATLLFKVKKLQ